MRGRGVGGNKSAPLLSSASSLEPSPTPHPKKGKRTDPPADAKAPTSGLLVDWGSLPPAAERELTAHLLELGLVGTARGSNLVPTIAEAELQLAQSKDARVTAKDMARAVQRATAALALQPIPQNSLYGFTSLCDAKFELDAKLIGAMVDRALSKPGVTVTDLRVLLKDETPITGGKPQSDLELAAMLIRQLVLHGGDSAQVALDPERTAFLEAALKEQGTSERRAMGGAGGVCANLGSVLPNVRASYYSREPLHEQIRERFSPSVKLVLPSGEAGAARDAPIGGQAASEMRTNYIAEYKQGEKLPILNEASFIIGGQRRELVAKGSSRVILGTQSTFEPGFGSLSPGQLQSLAKSQDVMFLVGAHYFTKASPEDALAKAKGLAEQLHALRAANPKLLLHFQYVVPKLKAQEAVVLRELAGAFGSMSLNSVELPGVLGRLRDAGLTSWAGDAKAGSAKAEEPAQVLSGAIALKEMMGLGRIHVHALLGDLLILDRVKDPNRQVLAMMRARQLASMKNANASGVIASPSDVWPVAPVVKGECLAGLYAFADALAARFPALAADPKAYQRVIERWWYEDPDSGRTYFFVPSRGLHDRTGGSVSTGDIIDAAGLALGLEETTRAKPLLHGSQFP